MFASENHPLIESTVEKQFPHNGTIQPKEFSNQRQIGYMLLATGAFVCACNVLMVTHTARLGVTTMEQVFAIGLVTTIIGALQHTFMARLDKALDWTDWQAVGLLVSSSASYASMLQCFFAALRILPVGNATALFITSVFMAPVLCKVFLHGEFVLRDIAVLIVALTGGVMIGLAEDGNGTNVIVPSWMYGLSIFLALCAALSVALSHLCMTAFSTHEIPSTVIAMSHGIGCIIAALIIQPNVPITLLISSKTELTGIMALCSGFIIGEIALNQGKHLTPTGQGLVARASELIYVYVFGAVFLGQVPSLPALLGAICIFGCVVFNGLVADEDEERIDCSDCNRPADDLAELGEPVH